jgi:hypothetical protein
MLERRHLPLAATVLEDASSSTDPRMRALLERVAGRQRSSAVLLRASGDADAARRAELSATRILLILDEPQATRRMKGLVEPMHGASPDRILDRALEGALALLGTELGNVQVRVALTTALTIAAHAGFDDEFLEYFALVDDEASACGRAARERAQTVIFDVNRDAGFAPHREIAAASGFRAVQSTPIVDPDGRLRAMISTHFRRPLRPSTLDLQMMTWFAEHVGVALARHHPLPTRA